VHLPALVVFRHIRQKMCRIECELPENSHHVLSLYLRVNAPTSPVPVLRKVALLLLPADRKYRYAFQILQ
jgi:hypothetical protein